VATIEDFHKLELRVGKIVSAEEFPEARNPAYKLTIDFGEFGIRRSSAQITSYYTAEELVGMQIVAVTNFPPRRVAGFVSEVLVLGVEDEAHKVILLTTERDGKPGSLIS
jgi:tRNA-binding protein